MEMMEVWWVAYAYMSSTLHGNARTIHMLVATSSQPLMTVFLPNPTYHFKHFQRFHLTGAGRRRRPSHGTEWSRRTSAGRLTRLAQVETGPHLDVLPQNSSSTWRFTDSAVDSSVLTATAPLLVSARHWRE